MNLITLILAIFLAITPTANGFTPPALRPSTLTQLHLKEVKANPPPTPATAISPGGSIASTAWAKYQHQLSNCKYPIVVTAVSTSVVAFIGDLASQVVLCVSARSLKKYDPFRSFVMLAIGATWTGPILHILYRYVNRLGYYLEKNRLNMNKTKRVACQVVVNQTIGAFTINAGFMFLFYSLNTLRPSNPSFEIHTALKLVKNKMKTIVGASWLIWVPASFTNFMYMPENSRVMFTNVVASFYNFILSIIANS
ncbi:hypothetical protein TrVE_jg7334 [Triparma verrucosa]|uniref:Uncharacterized protein n=1 Tax=Triparma verrucosa TaxID=1606542 RepID=A0A9W7KWW8_9STRA|nr:hypothetical protein TrVE_jg7334 [Triparma verrucosa]